MSEIIEHFICEFETWLSGQFCPALIAGVSEPPEPAELTLRLQPWIDQLADLGHNGILGNIQSEQAKQLAGMINDALNGLHKEYERYGASSSIMILALEPVDHILILLSLKSSLNGDSDKDV